MELTVHEKNKATNCANPNCRRTLLEQSFTYVFKGQHFCTRACRSTVTDEKMPEPKAAKSSEAAGAPVSKPKAEPGSQRAPRQVSSSDAPKRSGRGLSNPKAKLHIVAGKPTPKTGGSGNRSALWPLIKEGMTTGELYSAAEKINVDGKTTLAKIISAYGCVEVID